MFKDDISRYTAAQIVAALKCPRGTAYDWLDGRREPPLWQQPHWLKILRGPRAKSKKFGVPKSAKSKFKRKD